MDNAKERAIDNLRYAAADQMAAGNHLGGLARHQKLSELELAEIAAEQRKWAIRSNRRQALGHTLALGRRYDRAEDAIADAKVIADWIGLEID